MNARLYLRCLHPWGSLAIGSIYGLAGLFMTHGFMGAERSWPTSQFLTVTLAVPLLLGSFLAGTAHELLHSPSALLLPGLHRRLRRLTVVAVALGAGTVTLAAFGLDPSVPPPATFGLAAGLFTACFPNRYRFALGLPWIFGLTMLWTFFVTTWGATLRPAMIAAPWTFGFAGLAVATASTALLFARRHRRGRAATPYAALAPNNLFLAFDRPVVLRVAEQQKSNLALEGRLQLRGGPNWPVRRVAGGLGAWMQVLWHAGLGGQPRRGFWQVHALGFGVMLALALLFPLVAVPMERLLHNRAALSWADYWVLLGHYADPWSQLRATHGKGLDFVAFVAVFAQAWGAMVVALLAPLPQLHYPVSRRHLARVVFALVCRQLAGALLVSVGVMLTAGLIGRLGAGQLPPAATYVNLAGSTLLIAMCLPLFLCGHFLRHRRLAGYWGVGAMMLLMLAGFTPAFWPGERILADGLPFILTGLAASIALLWWRIRHRYRHTDLTGEAGIFNPGIQVRLAR